jgi:hypothetical protein
MSNRYEGYPDSWIDPYSCIYIKDNIVVGMIMLDPADNLEEQFAARFNATSWVYADDVFKAGAIVCPAVGYTYNGTDFTAPAVEEPTE